MKLTYIRGLDTIRALGVIFVVIYHLFTSSLPGGFFGVDMFFVISGFLATSILVKEHRENGFINIFRFFAKRVKRLLPAAAFMVVVTLALSLLISPDFRVGIQAQAAAVFGWMTNYYEIMLGGSYEGQHLPHLFVHTWTLAVEMHYYLIWGLVLGIIFYIFSKSKRKSPDRVHDGLSRSEKAALLIICIGIALFAYMRMQLGYSGTDDPSPIYYATSTRIYPLMIGSALGLLTGMRAPKKALPAAPAVILLMLSMIAIMLMTKSFSFSGEETYRYGILLVSLLTLLALFCVLSLQMKKYFGDLIILSSIGKRSYSIYLFHWPLYNIFKQMGIAGTGPFGENTSHIVYTLASIVATLILAEISYRVFEKGLSGSPRTKGRNAGRRQPSRLAKLTVAGFCVCILISLYTLANVPVRTSIEDDYLHQQVLINAYGMSQYNDYLAALQMSPVALHGSEEQLPSKPSEIENAQDVDGDAQQTQENAEAAVNRVDPAGPVAPIQPPGGANVTLIGDSVPLGAADILQQTIGSIVVDAEVSRNMGAGAQLVTEYANKGELGEYVVIALFTNVQNFTESATNDTMAAIPAGHRVIAVTPFGKDYMEEVAEMVRRLPQWYDYVTVADWNAAIRDHTDLLAPDGIHMKGDDSKQVYANLIAQAIEQASKKPAKK